MATGNFSLRRNAKILPVFCLQEDYDSECSEYDQEEDATFHIESIRAELESIFGASYVNYDPQRAVYDGDEVCTVYAAFSFAGYSFGMTIRVTYESGYYDGFTLDYELKDFEGYDFLPDSDDAQDILEDYDLNPGLAKMLAKKFAARIEKHYDAMAAKIDSVFAKIAPHVWEFDGAFSNGECLYHDVKTA